MRRHTVVFALAFTLAPIYAQQPLRPPLKNWAAPLYWQSTPAEARQLTIEQRIAHPDSSLAQAASIFTSPGPMTFIAMTPCRVLDTRGEPYSNLTGSFGPPNLASGVTRQVPLPTSTSCSIPSGAGAYSLNITAISDGGGLLSSFSVWPVGQSYPGVSTLNDSVPSGVVANAAIVVAGTSGAIQMVAFTAAGTSTDVIIDINGYYTAPTDLNTNTAIGTQALANVTAGNNNTAVGGQALLSNTTGGLNTATGQAALYNNTSGSGNAAFGQTALFDNTSGSGNTAVGQDALSVTTTGSNNTAIGYGAGPSTANLSNTTAIGYFAFVNVSSALILGSTGSNAVTVGIGTASPFNDYALDVDATTNSAINGGVVSNAGGGNIYLGMTNGVHKFRVDTNGNVYGNSYQTSGADFAESVAVSGSRPLYQPGDLLVIQRGARRTLTLSLTPYSTLVAGIYSTQPGLLATPRAIGDSLDGEVPLAVVGIVPCKVTAENGPIREGDLLVTSSTPGYAMKGTDRKRMLGAVVGKALEPLPKGSGVIQVLVTLQ